MHRNQDHLLRIPDHVLRDKVLSCFGYKDYVLASRACKYLLEHFDNAMDGQRLSLHVPQDCRSLEEAVQRIDSDAGSRKIPYSWVFPVNLVNKKKRNLHSVLVIGLILGLGCFLFDDCFCFLGPPSRKKNSMYAINTEEGLASCKRSQKHMNQLVFGDMSRWLANEQNKMLFLPDLHIAGRIAYIVVTICCMVCHLYRQHQTWRMTHNRATKFVYGILVGVVSLFATRVATIVATLYCTVLLSLFIPHLPVITCSVNGCYGGKCCRRQQNKKRGNTCKLTTIVIGAGIHKTNRNILNINSAMRIVGRPDVPKEKIVVLGGIGIEKGIQGNCHLQHMTLRQAEAVGVVGESSFTMEDVVVEQSGTYGVLVWGIGVVGRCTNVDVRQCGKSGVVASNGTSLILIGAKTTVHHNCTNNDSRDYGLLVFGSSSSTIQLVFPLTKEQVAIDNSGDGNWGAEEGGDINQIKTMTETEVAEAAAAVARGEVRVPADCQTLKEAVEKVQKDDRLTTIVLGKGEHQIDGEYLNISSATNIVGDPEVPKEEIVVVGGIGIKKGIQGNCRLQHLTLRQAKWHGVNGQSSFTMEDVLVEQCGGDGVVVVGTGVVGRCTNVQVRQCGSSGSASMWINVEVRQWWIHHIDRCQDDGASQLYKRTSCVTQ